MKSTSFINFTNHPSSQWSESQILAAKSFGEIIDLPFPSVDPFCDEEEIEQLAKQYVDKITDNNPVAVLCQGEYSLAYAVTFLLRQKQIPVLAACSSRMVTEVSVNGETRRESVFQFVRFREMGKGL